MAGIQQSVLLPGGRLHAEPERSSPELREFLAALAAPARRTVSAPRRTPQLHVLDSIGPDGAALVEAMPETVLALRRLQPGMQVFPLRLYTPTGGNDGRARQRGDVAGDVGPGRLAGRRGARRRLRRLLHQVGRQGVTDAKGEVQFALGGPWPPRRR